VYHNQIRTPSSSSCQLGLGVVLRYFSLSPYTSWVREAGCDIRAAGCPPSCCCYCCCQDIYDSGSDSGGDDSDSSYKDEWSSLSELMTSYWLRRVKQYYPWEGNP